MALLIRLIVTLIAGALAVFFFFKKGKPGETIAASGQKGSISVKADDGTAGGPAEHTTQPKSCVPPNVVDDEKSKGKSKAKGHVGDWYTMTGEAISDNTGAANAALAATVNTTTMSFTLKKNGRNVTPTIENEFTAELTDAVTAVVKLTATVVASPGGGTVASISKTYNLAPDPAKAGQIKITGDETDTMQNGKSKSYTEPGDQKTLNAGKYDCTYSLSINCSGKGIAKVIFTKCDLSLPG